MPIGYHVLSDIFNLECIVEQAGMVYTKNIVIDVLRDVFSQDRQYAYKSDVFGFPLTPSLLDKDPSAGLDDTETTRIFIGSSYRYDIKFNPSVIVRNTGSRYSPVSFNQDYLGVVNRIELLTDGYGNQSQIYVPAYHVRVGAWDQTLSVRIIAESEIDREEIADIVQVTLMGTRRQDLQNAGVFVKTLSHSGETETPYANDFLYIVDINLEVRTEWRVQIPISDVCERIGLCLSFGTLNGEISDALSINESLSYANEFPIHFTISPGSRTYGINDSRHGHIDGTIGVSAPDGFEWTAISNNDWITIVSGESGTGDGQILYAVADFSPDSVEDKRIGTITIFNRVFTIIQANYWLNKDNDGYL